MQNTEANCPKNQIIFCQKQGNDAQNYLGDAQIKGISHRKFAGTDQRHAIKNQSRGKAKQVKTMMQQAPTEHSARQKWNGKAD